METTLFCLKEKEETDFLLLFRSGNSSTAVSESLQPLKLKGKHTIPCSTCSCLRHTWNFFWKLLQDRRKKTQQQWEKLQKRKDPASKLPKTCEDQTSRCSCDLWPFGDSPEFAQPAPHSFESMNPADENNFFCRWKEPDSKWSGDLVPPWGQCVGLKSCFWKKHFKFKPVF